MAYCVIAMQNQTLAEKARRTAVQYRIKAEIVSIDPRFTHHGCSVGIQVDCREVDRLVHIFDKKRLSYGDIIGRGGNL